MKVSFGDVGHGTQARAARIRDRFVAGRTIEAHTAKCVAEKVWTESELTARAISACRAEVRDALGVIRDGLPFAGPTHTRKSGAPVWKQVELWTKADFVYNYAAYARRGGENIAVANSIAAACARIFGVGPKSLLIVEVDEEGIE